MSWRLFVGLKGCESSGPDLEWEKDVVRASRDEGDPADEVMPGKISGKGGGAWGDLNKGESSITFAG